MGVKLPLKRPLNRVKGQDKEAAASSYDMVLYERFTLWKDHAGYSNTTIARMLNRSEAAISQYLNLKYDGSISEIERDIENCLKREENLEFVKRPEVFCPISSAKLLWEVLQFCDGTCSMGVGVAPSGKGKTEVFKEYKRKNRATIFITLDVTTRHPSSVLKLITKRISGISTQRNISALLHAIIDRLKNSKRLVIIDDAHFLSWKGFECIRKIHDCAGVGVAYLGQERLYDQMVGGSNRAFLFDQIYSRICIKRDQLFLTRSDVRLIADSICPGLDKPCIDFLSRRAQGKGRLRVMSNILRLAMKMGSEFGTPMNLDHLKEASRFLMI